MASHNQPAVVDEPRAVRFSPLCFYAYRVTEKGTTLPLIVDCSTLDEALNGAMVHCFHKEHLLIREVADARTRNHLYAIKKRSAPTYIYRDHEYHRQDRLYAAPVCVIEGDMLAGGAK
jgi:hypothetical protein